MSGYYPDGVTQKDIDEAIGDDDHPPDEDEYPQDGTVFYNPETDMFSVVLDQDVFYLLPMEAEAMAVAILQELEDRQRRKEKQS